MKYVRKVLWTLFVSMAIFAITPAISARAEGLNGLAPDSEGNWYYYMDGQVDSGYSGLYCDGTAGWWLVNEGMVNFEYTGLYCDETYGWWLISNGRVMFEYTGLWNDEVYGWWLIDGGAVAFPFTGLWNDANCGWWLIGSGRVMFEYTGLWNDEAYGWWLIDGGAVAFPFTGLWNDPNCGWWLIGSGRVLFEYTGLWNDEAYGWWLIDGGAVAFPFTGLWNDTNCGWWLIREGTVAFDYSGPWNDPVYGSRIISNGAVTDNASNAESGMCQQKVTEHFVFYCYDQDINVLEDLSMSLEENYDRITSDLNRNVPGRTDVNIYPDLESYHIAIDRPNAPDWSIGTAKNDSIYMVSPQNPGPSHTYDSVVTTVVHEFVHIVVAQFMQRQPKYLNEGIACYEAGQIGNIRYNIPRDRKNGTLLSLYDLRDFDSYEDSTGRVYTYGPAYIDFIVKTYGFDGILAQLEGRSQTEVYGKSMEQLNQEWMTYLYSIEN